MADLKLPDQRVTAGLPPPLRPEESPFWPSNLVDLLFRPTDFFEKKLALGHRPYAVIVAWALGASAFFDRIDQRLLRAELGSATARSDEMVELMLASWPNVWITALLFGAVGGLFIWYVGGWWCKVRLRWCGVKDPDPYLARLLLVYSSFVFAGPHVLSVAIQTAFYEDYMDAYANDFWLSIAVLLMVFWSTATTYKGAVAMFAPRVGLARLWFLILPALVYFLTIGGMAIFMGAAE